MNTVRQYSLADRLILGLEEVFAPHRPGETARIRPNPADAVEDRPLTAAMRRHSGALMRVNHAGEVSAQALYQGQGLTARSPRVRRAMRQASDEENDHLAWCEARLEELGDHKSRLTPLWFFGSFAIGGVAGVLGDRWSLGFLAETERQVVRHLDGHLHRLPPRDLRSRRIIEQMKLDEGRHAHQATSAGGRELPGFIGRLMTRASRIMTFTAARI